MGEMIRYASNGGSAEGYLAGEGGPGVVVIQEWWGLNDQIKGVADRFASEGFTALAPDFYHGKGAAIGEPDEAGKLMMALNADQAARDARGAAQELSRRTGGTVGVIGFCMGGQLALLTGTVAPEEVGAVVNCYGVHPAVQPDLSKMSAAVLGIFAEKDDFVGADVRAALDEALSDAGVPHEFHVYPGVDHAFMNDQRPDAYHEEHSEDAWAKSIAWFRKYLQ